MDKTMQDPEASIRAAENMVCSRLLDDKNIPRNFDNFSIKIRTSFPEMILEAKQYIGETREIEVPQNMTPKEFQRRFHTVVTDSNGIGEWRDSFSY